MAALITGGTQTGSVDMSVEDAALSDIRREAEVQAAVVQGATQLGVNEVIKETLKANWKNQDAIKDARYDINTNGTANTDRIISQTTANFISEQNQAYSTARDLAALTASSQLNNQKMTSDIATAQALNAAATALESSKLGSAIALGQSVLGSAVALGQANLGQLVIADGATTRALINELKYADLNRSLIERNAELVEERSSARHWRNTADSNQFGAQFAQLQSMMQNFQSQLSTTSQGMNNFGSMAGPVGQTSTSNNVK